MVRLTGTNKRTDKRRLCHVSGRHVNKRAIHNKYWSPEDKGLDCIWRNIRTQSTIELRQVLDEKAENPKCRDPI